MADTDRLAEQLRAIFGVTAATAAIAAPVGHRQLLEMIVRTAAYVIHARAASLLLIDETTQELVFEIATSEDVAELKNVRVPLGEGIAGLVAVTGQPLAVADAQADPRHAHEIAQQTGYLPRSLLCVPLEFEDRVIGVIELMDKQGAPVFDADDMQALSLFARQAAVAIEQSQVQRNLANLLRELLVSLGQTTAASDPSLRQRVDVWANELQADQEFRRSLELAVLVHEIAQQGDDESEACLAILRGFGGYLGARQRHTRLGYSH